MKLILARKIEDAAKDVTELKSGDRVKLKNKKIAVIVSRDPRKANRYIVEYEGEKGQRNINTEVIEKILDNEKIEDKGYKTGGGALSGAYQNTGGTSVYSRGNRIDMMIAMDDKKARWIFKDREGKLLHNDLNKTVAKYSLPKENNFDTNKVAQELIDIAKKKGVDVKASKMQVKSGLQAYIKAASGLKKPMKDAAGFHNKKARSVMAILMKIPGMTSDKAQALVMHHGGLSAIRKAQDVKSLLRFKALKEMFSESMAKTIIKHLQGKSPLNNSKTLVIAKRINDAKNETGATVIVSGDRGVGKFKVKLGKRYKGDDTVKGEVVYHAVVLENMGKEYKSTTKGDKVIVVKDYYKRGPGKDLWGGIDPFIGEDLDASKTFGEAKSKLDIQKKLLEIAEKQGNAKLVTLLKPTGKGPRQKYGLTQTKVEAIEKLVSKSGSKEAEALLKKYLELT